MAHLFKSNVRTIAYAGLALLVLATGLVPKQTYAAEANERLLARITTTLVETFEVDKDEELIINDVRAQKIRKFFKGWEDVNLYIPAEKYAEDFVFYGDLYGVDPYLVAAIAFNESGGFQERFMCGDNGFGWDIPPGTGCRDQFRSIRHAIQVVSYNLAGHNPDTARYYKDKTLEKIVDAYNPPSINPAYKTKILDTMGKMKAQEV